MWIAEKGQHVSIQSGAWEDPFAWGIVLADLARHIALAHQMQGSKVDPEAFLAHACSRALRPRSKTPRTSPRGEIRY